MAVAAYHRALALQPSSSALYSDLGAALSASGDRHAAAAAYAHTIDVALRFAHALPRIQ